MIIRDFPGGSAGQESACSAGDPSSITGWRRSPGEGIGYPFQCSWTPLVAQMVGNPPAMQETWVGSLGQEDPLEKGMATHSSIPAWRTPWTEEPGGLQSIGSKRVGYNWTIKHSTQYMVMKLKFSCDYLLILEVPVLKYWSLWSTIFCN